MSEANNGEGGLFHNEVRTKEKIGKKKTVSVSKRSEFKKADGYLL